MAKNFGKCESLSEQKALVFKEKQSKMIFNNPAKKKLRRIQVDGCLELQGAKCDYLMISPAETEHFVELKGGDVKHSTRQLESTILAISLEAKKALKHCFVISTRCPLLSPEIQNLKKKFKNNFNSTLTIKNFVCEFLVD